MNHFFTTNLIDKDINFVIFLWWWCPHGGKKTPWWKWVLNKYYY